MKTLRFLLSLPFLAIGVFFIIISGYIVGDFPEDEFDFESDKR